MESKTAVHNAWIAHLLETKGIQGVIGYRRHTHKGAHYGKYRFRYDPVCDEYICPEKQRLTWKTTTREGYRQYCCEGKTCKGCPRRAECFGASMSRKVVERHVWQDALERVDAFTKTHRGKRIYGWRKETIERSFAEAKENHGLRYARMLGIRNMREQCFLTAAVQNIKRLVASFYRVYGVYGNFEVHSSFLIQRRIDHLNAHKPPHPLTADMDIVGGLYIVKPLILCKLGADTVG